MVVEEVRVNFIKDLLLRGWPPLFFGYSTGDNNHLDRTMNLAVAMSRPGAQPLPQPHALSLVALLSLVAGLSDASETPDAALSMTTAAMCFINR